MPPPPALRLPNAKLWLTASPSRNDKLRNPVAITPLVALCLGGALVAGALGYVALCAFVRRSFRIFGRSITLPDTAPGKKPEAGA